LNGAFLTMAIANGLTSAITNPLESEIKRSIMAADVFMGNDENCLAWIQSQTPAAAAGDGARRERRSRRRRRAE